jgi:hypothetical protein
MPYVWRDAELFLSHKGVTIYHTYRHDMFTDPYDYIFTTSLDRNAPQFDIREVGALCPMSPDIDTNQDWRRLVLIQAIDSGFDFTEVCE